MNYQNRKRWLISKLKKLLKNNLDTDYIISETQEFISDKYCFGCMHDDFGYCDFPIDEDFKRHRSVCIPRAIEFLERLD